MQIVRYLGEIYHQTKTYRHLSDFLQTDVAQQTLHVAPHRALRALEPLTGRVIDRILIRGALVAALALEGPGLLLLAFLVCARTSSEFLLAGALAGSGLASLHCGLTGWFGTLNNGI